jgi:hypothetical protein
MAFVKFRTFLTRCASPTKRRGAIGRVVVRVACVMFEAYRLNGRPRQKWVGFLGSYYPSEAGDAERVAEFWAKIERKLGSLDISRADYIKAVAKIERMVPRPTVREMMKEALNLKVLTPRDFSGDYLLPRARRAARAIP